jgi:hypothetical protein
MNKIVNNKLAISKKKISQVEESLATIKALDKVKNITFSKICLELGIDENKDESNYLFDYLFNDCDSVTFK